MTEKAAAVFFAMNCRWVVVVEGLGSSGYILTHAGVGEIARIYATEADCLNAIRHDWNARACAWPTNLNDERLGTLASFVVTKEMLIG